MLNDPQSAIHFAILGSLETFLRLEKLSKFRYLEQVVIQKLYLQGVSYQTETFDLA